MRKKNKIPWSEPWIGDEEAQAVVAAFEDNWVSMGPRTQMFETNLRRRTGVDHAVFVANGTVALDIALDLLSVGSGDEVVLPAFCYAATAFAVMRRGAVPVFADVSIETLCLDGYTVSQALTEKTKAIIVIDYAGTPADHASLLAVSKSADVPVLLDGAHSLGTKTDDDRQTFTLYDVSTVSFHAAKVMTTVEGGAVLTNDAAFARKARILRNQGEHEQEKYLHLYVGYNARPTDVSAAVGLVQLDKLDDILADRRSLVGRYRQNLDGHSYVWIPDLSAHGVSNHFMIPVCVFSDRGEVVRRLAEEGIDTRICYPRPLYRQPFVESTVGPPAFDCPVTEWVTQRIVNLPLYYGLRYHQIDKVCDVLLDAIS